MTNPDAGAPAVPMTIDPRTLGRPVHLLPAFAARFGADLGDFLRLGPNRRYGTGFEARDAGMRQLPESAEPGRWAVYGAPAGRIGLCLDRSLVLRLLRCRYGLNDVPEGDGAAMPVTASEERLERKLGLQLATALAHRICEGLQPAGAQPGNEYPESLAWLADSTMPTGTWRLQVRFVEPRQGTDALLRFSLDEGWMRLLLAQLSSDRAAAREVAAKPAEPLASRLKVRLVARLLRQRVSLGEVMALRVGDVLPVNLQDTDVLVKDSRLFTATVAEHKGRLWLTAFNDI